MSISVTFNSTAYSIPVNLERGWGDNVTAFLLALGTSEAAPQTLTNKTLNTTVFTGTANFTGATVTGIGGTGTVTSVGISGSDFTITSSPVTTSGTIGLALATTGVGAGTYTSLTVNAKGQVTAGTNPGFITANQTITLSGDGTGSGTTAIALTLKNTGTPGTYTSVTTDAQGRITAGTNPGFITANQTITLSSDVTGSGTTAITATLAASGISAGTYGAATYDSKGRATASANVGGQVTYIGTVANGTVAALSRAPRAMTINSIWAQCSAGSCTVAVQINGTNVTGLSAVAVTTVGGTTSASGANSVAATNRITVVITAASGCSNLEITINAT